MGNAQCIFFLSAVCPPGSVTSSKCLMLTALKRSHPLFLDTGRFMSVTTFIKQTREVRTLVVQPLASESYIKRSGSTGMAGELEILRRLRNHEVLQWGHREGETSVKVAKVAGSEMYTEQARLSE